MSSGATTEIHPELPQWSADLLNKDASWYHSVEAITIADHVILYQSPQGGWPKSTDLARKPRSIDDIPQPGSSVANTIDNDATTVPMQYLAKVISATGDQDYIKAFNKGLQYLFAAQYDNGGWPQFWPLRGDKYYSRITYNDGAMIRVMNLLRDVSKGEEPYAFVSDSDQKRAAKAIAKGLECILKTQIEEDGVLKVWCAQHDEQSYAPAWARAYEPPSLSGSESVGILRYLMSIDDPSPAVITAVKAGVSWLQSVAMTGTRLNRQKNEDGRTEAFLTSASDAPLLWARFYELGTDRPLYLDRDSEYRYDFSEISYERRSGYAYHGYWPEQLIYEEYPIWLSKL